ncbi:MAG: hypothetical protein Q4F88_06900, partial [Eubacteriales bacterium]|nr:hypothetical protein [Eubacteriales bacterium]
RNKNGYCKIYDKAKEQDLETPLTRIEHTITTAKTTKSISFENVYIKSKKKDKELKINSTYQCIVDLCKTLEINELPYESIINKLDKRTKRAVKEALINSGYEKLELNQIIHDRLLKNIKSAFKINDVITTDNDGLLQIDDDYQNPWES